MRYYTLKSNFVLRGWSDIPYALLDLDCRDGSHRVTPLTKKEFEAIELATVGGVSPDESFMPQSMRKMADRALEQGFFVECGRKTVLADYQKYRCTKARYTFALLWSITGNCNLRCRHCYISSDQNCYGEPTFEQCEEVIRQCLDANIHMVALTGGEPLVRKDFWRLVDRLLENHIRVLQVFTNGMAVNERFMDEFDRRDINPNYFMVSFDGVNCHDWLRGVDGAEKRALDAIRLFHARGYETVVSMALHMGNIASLPETYALMKELGVAHFKAVPIVDTGNWKKQGQRAMDLDVIYCTYLDVIQAYIRDGMPLRLGFGGFFQGNKGRKTYWAPFESGCGSCERCSDSLCESAMHIPYLLPDGRLLPCIAMSGSSLEELAPNLFSEGQSLTLALSDSRINDYIKYKYQDLFEHNQECASCAYKYKCSGCRANALAEGDYFGKDPLACHYFKGGYSQTIRELLTSSGFTNIRG